MMIFWRHNLAFMAVPKTGTHAYQALVGRHADMIIRHPQPLKHMGLGRFNLQLRPMLETPDHPIETLAIIRDPIDWLGSWYRYRSRLEPAENASSTAGISFNEFITAYLQEDPPEFAQVGRQSGMLTAEGDQAVDYLFKYENPNEICWYLSERLRRNLGELPVMNKSPAGDLTLSEVLRSRLQQELAVDFELHANAYG